MNSNFVYTGVGQVIYNGDSNSTTTKLSNLTGKDLPLKDLSNLSEDDPYGKFQEKVIYCASPFKKDTTYYYRIEIERDSSILDLDLKLVNSKELAGRKQQVKRHTVAPLLGTNASQTLVVIIFEEEDGPFASVVEQVDSLKETGFCLFNNILYRDGKKVTSKYTILSVKNPVSQDTDDIVAIEGIFSPLDHGFDGLYLKINRTEEDFHIFKEGSYSGRTIILGENVDIYSLQNILTSEKYLNGEASVLNKIGVWGTPGLIFSINGEEIKINNNGYYELDVLPVSSLGFAITESSSHLDFTVDYQYYVKENNLDQNVVNVNIEGNEEQNG